MKNQSTVFEQIREKIARNEVNCDSKHFFIYQTTPQYPTGVLKFLVNNKVLKITDVKKEYNNGFEFKISYTDLDENNKFVSKAIKSLEYEEYKRDKRARDKAIKNMTFREELECPNFSNVEDETGYMACPKNTGGFEMIEPQDRCTTDFILSELGYESYDDFVSDNKDIPIQELTTQMYEQLRAFEKQKCARDWEIGEDELNEWEQ